MNSERTAKTRQNIKRLFAILGIREELRFIDHPEDNEDRSRVHAEDVNGLVLRHAQSHCKGDGRMWDEGSGDNHNAHGVDVDGTWRTRSTPSAQICKKNRQFYGKPMEYDYFLEIDIDLASPHIDFVAHAAEVLSNKFTGRKTDPDKVASLIEKLGSTA